MNKMRNKLVKLVVTTSLLGSVGVGLSSVVLGDAIVAQAETVSKDTTKFGVPIGDKTSSRTVTVKKYSIKDSSGYGEEGTGEEATVDPTKATPLPGIKFKVQRVKPVGDASLTDPMTQKVDTDYTVDTTFTEQTITTDASGNATIDISAGLTSGSMDANDGIYLFTELDDDRGVEPKVQKPADPFFVYVPQTHREKTDSLIYDVVVQPKNQLESLLKPDKTVEGDKKYSIKAGQSFNWEATANVPDGLYSVASKDMTIEPIYDAAGVEVPGGKLTVAAGDAIFGDFFTFTDAISDKLAIQNVVLQGQKDGSTTWEDFDFGTDYTVKVNGTVATAPVTAAAGTTNTVEVSVVKPAAASATNPVGMQKVQGYKKVRVVYTTLADKDFNGSIANEFDVKYQVPGGKPVEKPSENNPKYYNGGFNVVKTAEDTKDALAGAEFHIAETEDNARKNIFIAENGKSYGKADGTGTVKDAQDAAIADGTTLLVSTSDADGKAVFNGLKLIWFTDTNNNGKQDAGEPTFTNESDIKKDYWLVETKAPTDYELLKVPVKVTVDLNSINNTTIEAGAINVIDKKKTKLPFTGGQGTALLVAIAIGTITVGTAVITVEKKRRQA